MTLRRLIVPLVAMVFGAASCSTFAVAAATVNGAKITESAVESELGRVRSDPNFQEILSRDQGRGEARRAILNGLIRQQVLEQEARKQGIDVTEQQIDRLISQEAQRLGLGVEEFLEVQNLTRADLEELAGRVVREFELSRRVVGDADVDDEDVLRFYELNEAAFEEAHLRRITVRTQGEARSVLEELGAGSFAEVAEEHSIDELAAQGGDMGYVPLAELSTEAQAVIRQASVGRVTDPVPTASGFEVYRVLDRRTRSLELVEDQIKTQLSEQTRGARFEEWVTERLRAARIVVNPKYGRFDRRAAAVVTGTGELRD